MCGCVYVLYVYTCVFGGVCTCVSVRVSTHICVCVHTCVFVYMFGGVCTCVSLRKYVHVCVGTCVFVHLNAHTCE